MLRVDESSDADTARYAAYDRLAPLLAATVRDGPLLVLIDDVQWADPMSLRFLTYLADTLDVPGLAVVLTQRDAGLSLELGKLLAAIARRQASVHLALPPLSSDEVAELASSIRGGAIADGDARELAVRTGGNPFFVCEYARLSEGAGGPDDIPIAVRSVLRLRLAALDAEVLAVLELAAVIGTVLDIGLLSAAARLGRDGLGDLLDQAADAHIVVAAPGGGEYVFVHGLLRDEILTGLPVTRRQRLNLRVAQAIDPAGTGEALGKRATHLVAALPLADPAEALAACRAAAAEAERNWASDSAAVWWELALTVLHRTGIGTPEDHDEVTISLVSALARAGRSQTVLDTVDAALLDAIRSGRTGSAGRLAAVLLRTSGAWPWIVYGADPGPLLARLDGLAAHVTADVGARARILAALAVGRVYHPDDTLRDRLSLEAIELAESLGDPEVLADALLGRALTLCALAVYSVEVLDILDRLATIGHRYDQVDDVITQGIRFNAKMALGDPGAAEHVRLGSVGSDVLRLPVARMQMRWAEAQLVHWRGDNLNEAEQMYERAITAHRRTELYESAVHDIARLTLRWDQGRLHEFPELADADPVVLPWARAIVAAASQDPAADELIRRELARVEPLVWTLPARLTMLAHAVVDRRLRDEAGPLRKRLEPLAGYVANVGLVGTAGTVALGLARLCAFLDDLAAAREHLAIATAISRRTDGRVSLLRCRMVAVQLDVEAGRVPDPNLLRAVADEAAARGVQDVRRQAEALMRVSP